MSRRKESIPIFSVKLYMYQLARALAHIHGMGICHRDIKPHNLLVDPVRQVLKLCDFGSAKVSLWQTASLLTLHFFFVFSPQTLHT